MASGDIEVTTTWDLGFIRRQLTDAARKVFTEYESETLDYYQDRWVGWKYEGRPAGAPRLVSFDAWSTRTVTTSKGPALVVINEARDWRYGRPYAEYVARRKGAQAEWLVVTADWERDVLPRMTRDLTQAVVASLSQPAPSKKVRPEDGGVTETLTLVL